MRQNPASSDLVHSPRELLVGTGLMFAVVLAVLLVASYPGAVLLGAAASVPIVAGGWLVLTRRQRRGRSRSVCIPHTGVCLRA